MIPKIIHYCWFGNGELSELAKKCIGSWKKYCPDYEIKQWNETNFDISECKYMKQAYEAKKWGFVPDYARNKIIYENGGFYFDTDVEIVKNLDSLLNEKCIISFESSKFVNGGNIIAGEKGNPVLKSLFEIYHKINFCNEKGTLNTTPSPFYNTEVLKTFGLQQNNTLQRLPLVTIYPTDYFCPKDVTTKILNVTSNTYSIHHFDGSWLDANSIYMNKVRQKAQKLFGKTILSKIVIKFFQSVVLKIKNFSKNIKTKGLLITLYYYVNKFLNKIHK